MLRQLSLETRGTLASLATSAPYDGGGKLGGAGGALGAQQAVDQTLPPVQDAAVVVQSHECVVVL